MPTVSEQPVIGILSIGEMGMGVAKRLQAYGLTVTTCIADRSKHTIDRIKAANIQAYDNDHDFVVGSDIILSIVPPRDAIATAKRILDSSQNQDTIKRRQARDPPAPESLLYLDLNAISPTTTRNIQSILAGQPETPASPAPRRLSLPRGLSFRANSKDNQGTPPLEPIQISYLDGGIIGGPPSLTSGSNQAAGSSTSSDSWYLPSVVISGPHADNLLSASLIETLSIQILDDKIGTASTLKSCFASLTKGMTALCILSFTTAQTANVLPHLRSHLEKFSPATLQRAEGSLTGMPPKAYRWVEEMRQIGTTFASEGGLPSGENLFNSVAEIYKIVAEDTVLGEEKTGHRKRGRTADDVAECMREGIKRKREQGTDRKKLDLAWRGSWS